MGSASVWHGLSPRLQPLELVRRKRDGSGTAWPMRWIAVVVRAACQRQAEPAGQGDVVARCRRVVVRVIGLEGVETIASEERQPFIVGQQPRMRERRNPPGLVN